MKSRVALSLGAVALVTLIAPSAASATSWYSQSSPLTAYENRVAQAQAYGNWVNENGSYGTNRLQQKDPRPGGDSIYVDTDLYIYGPWYQEFNGQYPVYWKYVDGKESSRTNVNSWQPKTVRQALTSNGTAARGSTHVCEDQSFSGDPCSVWTYPSFNY